METRFNAAYALNKLAMNEENHQVMGEGEVLPPLVTLADEEGDARCQALSALRRLALLAANRLEMVELGVLDPVATAAEQGDEETRRECAALLCNLSVSDENKLEIALGPVLLPLLQLCQSADVEAARLACAAVANVAEDGAAHGPLVEAANAVHHLCYLMRSRHLAVHREAARAVANLLSTERAHAPFLYENGLRSLNLVARSPDNECQYNAALCFRKLSPNLANHDALIGAGSLQPLFGLIRLRDAAVQRQAAAALRDLNPAGAPPEIPTPEKEASLQDGYPPQRSRNDELWEETQKLARVRGRSTTSGGKREGRIRRRSSSRSMSGSRTPSQDLAIVTELAALRPRVQMWPSHTALLPFGQASWGPFTKRQLTQINVIDISHIDNLVDFFSVIEAKLAKGPCFPIFLMRFVRLCNV
uniref:Vacuolar protein 8 n=1 Tax=Heterosigma akashiwo TaxID=2829 RepID=A0A7S3XPT1_HETAK